jgi:hypothetical protein
MNMSLTRSTFCWKLPIWTYVGGVPAVGMFMFGQHFADAVEGVADDGQGRPLSH